MLAGSGYKIDIVLSNLGVKCAYSSFLIYKDYDLIWNQTMIESNIIIKKNKKHSSWSDITNSAIRILLHELSAQIHHFILLFCIKKRFSFYY